ncbi:MAG TPA: hypothetical protein VJ023_19125 [Pyrinomonadaceae bacterium]|nr:hypothetical protein [Pyrinomonadaceae bacterium]
MTKQKKPKSCSNCGSKRIVTITYWMPDLSEELWRKVDEGKIVLGGCVVTDFDPKWQCVDCGETIH